MSQSTFLLRGASQHSGIHENVPVCRMVKFQDHSRPFALTQHVIGPDIDNNVRAGGCCTGSEPSLIKECRRCAEVISRHCDWTSDGTWASIFECELLDKATGGVVTAEAATAHSDVGSDIGRAR